MHLQGRERGVVESKSAVCGEVCHIRTLDVLQNEIGSCVAPRPTSMCLVQPRDSRNLLDRPRQIRPGDERSRRIGPQFGDARGGDYPALERWDDGQDPSGVECRPGKAVQGSRRHNGDFFSVAHEWIEEPFPELIEGLVNTD